MYVQLSYHICIPPFFQGIHWDIHGAGDLGGEANKGRGSIAHVVQGKGAGATWGLLCLALADIFLCFGGFSHGTFQERWS